MRHPAGHRTSTSRDCQTEQARPVRSQGGRPAMTPLHAEDAARPGRGPLFADEIDVSWVTPRGYAHAAIAVAKLGAHGSREHLFSL